MPHGGFVTSDSDIESIISLQTDKIRRNSLGPKYWCSIDGCNLSFKRLDQLDRHEYKHTGIKRHACHFDGCSKAYTITTHLKRHIRSSHEKPINQVVKNVPCELDTCDKLFTSISNMQRHKREVHENPKVYKCQFCEESFTQKLKLRRHEISKHTKVYPHNCEKCTKGFFQKWQWQKHEERCKIYACPSCEKIFEKWTLFLRHCKDTKHSQKYYKCEYCERAYTKPVELQNHVAVKHLADENFTAPAYKCQYECCEKSYAYEKNLRQHVITTHEGKKYKCTRENCDKNFSSSQNLRKHIKRDHASSRFNDGYLMDSSKSLLKRKKRKDAGVPKISVLAKYSGININRDLNKRLKCRDKDALDEVSNYLSQDIDINSPSDCDGHKGDDNIANEIETKEITPIEVEIQMNLVCR